ncbi:hypothetical protein ARZXY2_4942 (plasmid) [Arthrobacter sp. ZXY-2]|nr:hypothetical protein ARZXY2_4942 [Arthrobacter sp. ZXY-2]
MAPPTIMKARNAKMNALRWRLVTFAVILRSISTAPPGQRASRK